MMATEDLEGVVSLRPHPASLSNKYIRVSEGAPRWGSTQLDYNAFLFRLLSANNQVSGWRRAAASLYSHMLTGSCSAVGMIRNMSTWVRPTSAEAKSCSRHHHSNQVGVGTEIN